MSNAKQFCHQLMKFQQLLHGVEVIKVNGVNRDRDTGEALRVATPSTAFFLQRFVTKINLNVTSQEKVTSQSRDRYGNCMAWRPYFKLRVTFIAKLLTYANLT